MIGSPEFWLSLAPVARAGDSALTANVVERQGWDGLCLSDSQHLAPDVFVALGLAAAATTTLRLATGVANTATREMAVLASAIGAVHVESDGRAILGMGRGDSALAHLGRHPVPVDGFERSLRQLRAYLNGEVVAEHDHPATVRWLRATRLAPVLLDVAATGPKVIAAAARTADMITFAVGASSDRLRDGIAIARQARAAAGGDPDTLRFGAWVNMSAHPDSAVARTVVRGRASTFARFSAMHGAPTERLDPHTAQEVATLVTHYELATHGQSDSPQAVSLSDEFLDQFAIVGEPSMCAERLGALLAAVPELERIVVASGHRGAHEAQRAEVQACMAEQVLPAIR